MTGDTAVHQLGSGRWLRAADAWWSLLRVVLVVLWVGWAAATWWSAPRSATVAQARADLSAGRMASYEWAELSLLAAQVLLAHAELADPVHRPR